MLSCLGTRLEETWRCVRCRDTIALMVTALLGIGSFAVQGKLSKDAEARQRGSELAQDEREKARLAAAIQLDRVRLQVCHALRCTR